jgi:hypothetical protein
MDDTRCQQFFQQPTCPAQRQYEALRAVFLDGLSQKNAAERFGYDYDAFRQLVHQFRDGCRAGNPPPFSPPSGAAGRSPRRGPRRSSPTFPTEPTPVSSHSILANGGERASRASFSSFRSWLRCASSRSSRRPLIPVRQSSQPTRLC